MSKYVLKKRKIPMLPPPISPDWAVIVRTLVSAGVPKQRIALCCRMSRETVDAIYNGQTEPRWSQGQMLLALQKYVAAPPPETFKLS